MALECNLSADKMIKKIFIFTYTGDPFLGCWKTESEPIRKKFEMNGYVMPNIMFWDMKFLLISIVISTGDMKTCLASTTGHGQAVEVPSNAPAQCPISKSQCEQLLALFNAGTDQGSNHHVASVSTSAAASSMISGATGVTAATGVPSTSLSSSSNAHSGFVDIMSDPFLPSAVEGSCSADATNFVTPISISESSHLDITDPPSHSHHHFQVPLPSDPLLSSPTQLPHSDSEPSSSPPVASAPPHVSNTLLTNLNPLDILRGRL
nr:hypothetical protein CFP56_10564 [Quercus suber]